MAKNIFKLFLDLLVFCVLFGILAAGVYGLFRFVILGG